MFFTFFGKYLKSFLVLNGISERFLSFIKLDIVECLLSEKLLVSGSSVFFTKASSKMLSSLILS